MNLEAAGFDLFMGFDNNENLEYQQPLRLCKSSEDICNIKEE